MAEIATAAAPWRRYDAAEDRLTLQLHVQPGAARTEWAGVHGDRVKLRLKARPVEGAANRALVEFLAQALAVTQRDVTIVRGENARAKTVEVRGAGPTAAGFPGGVAA